MEKCIIIKPTFDTKSLYKANLYFLINSKLKYFLFILLIILSYNFFKDSIYKKNDIISIVLVLLIAIFSILMVLIVYFLGVYRLSRKQILENPRLKENIVYILNDEFFQEKGESYEIKHFWKNINKVVEKKELFFIYINKNRANFIKKTDLKNEQYDELKQLFNSLNIKKSLK